jgi:protein-tyrosine-phosphatase/predicted ATP-grasp superfamily ATP-dependent carboligase
MKGVQGKALILGADASAAVAVVQALGRDRVLLHAVCRRDSLSAASRFVSRVFDAAPEAADPSALLWVRDIDAEERYSLVVPTTESSLRILHACADDDPLRQKAVLASRASIEIALDKAATCSLAGSFGIPVPHAVVMGRGATPDHVGGYPVVLKTLRSQVLRGESLAYAPACIARNQAMREAFIAKWGPYSDIVQQTWVPGVGWGIECLYDRGRLCWWFAHERLHELPLTGGASTYRRARSDPPYGLLNAAKTLLDALEWHGVAMVEFRVEPSGRFVLLEINPRFWGSLPLAIAAGVNFPAGLMRLAAGERLGTPGPTRDGLAMRNLSEDLMWARENWCADSSDPLLQTHPRLASLLEWLRVLTGRDRWDHFTWTDPGPGFAQLKLLVRHALRFVSLRVSGLAANLHARWQHERSKRRYAKTRVRGGRLVFVCHGNICRSPLAEHLARLRSQGWVVASTGLQATAHAQSPAHIQRVAASMQADLSGHQARRFTQQSLESADLVVVMDHANFKELSSRFPDARGRILFLGLFGKPGQLEIADPINFDENTTMACAMQIRDAINGLADWTESLK